MRYMNIPNNVYVLTRWHYRLVYDDSWYELDGIYSYPELENVADDVLGVPWEEVEFSQNVGFNPYIMAILNIKYTAYDDGDRYETGPMLVSIPTVPDKYDPTKPIPPKDVEKMVWAYADTVMEMEGFVDDIDLQVLVD